MTRRGPGFFDFFGRWGRISFHRRNHHPEIPFGAWRLCINGIQFFAGRFAVTVNWPSGWSK